MKTCSLCSAPMDDRARACPRCGIAAESPALARGRVGLALRPFVVAASGLAVLTALALPMVRAARGASSCEPHSWTDWHVAVQRACVTPAYVCENMTSAKLLQDPEITGELRDALGAGQAQGSAMDDLDAVVGHLRDVYGCEGAGAPHGVRGAPPEPVLPPGHPPIPSSPRSPMFEGPPTLTI
jgi:hypothetical protein